MIEGFRNKIEVFCKENRIDLNEKLTPQEKDKIRNVDFNNVISLSECFLICRNKINNLACKVPEKVEEEELLFLDNFKKKDVKLKVLGSNTVEEFLYCFDLDELQHLISEYKDSKSFDKQYYIKNKVKNLINQYYDDIINLINMFAGDF